MVRKEKERDRWVLRSVGDMKRAAFGWGDWEYVREQRSEQSMGLSSTVHGPPHPFTDKEIRTQRTPRLLICTESEEM